MNVYLSGEPVELEFSIVDNNGDPVDPASLTLSFGNAALTPTVWAFGGFGSIVRDSEGNYHAIIPTSGVDALWVYQWEAKDSGNNIIALDDGKLTVIRPIFPVT